MVTDCEGTNDNEHFVRGSQASDCPVLPELDDPLPSPPLPSLLIPTREKTFAHLYVPIQPHQTRLLVLQPAEFGSTLRAQLLTADLLRDIGEVAFEGQCDIEYTALSYTWVKASLQRQIVSTRSPCIS